MKTKKGGHNPNLNMVGRLLRLRLVGTWFGWFKSNPTEEAYMLFPKRNESSSSLAVFFVFFCGNPIRV